MMVLHQAASTSFEPHSNPMRPSVRRRRSKGTLAGFASGKDSSPATQDGAGDHTESISHAAPVPAASQPQHATEASPAPPKPCHYARLALMCAENAVRMGARVQLNLCPPGQLRRELQTTLRQRLRSQHHIRELQTTMRSPQQLKQSSSRDGALSEAGSFYSLDKMVGPETLASFDLQEEEYLMNTNTFEVESDEEVSSGDEDELADVDHLLVMDNRSTDVEESYMTLRENLYTPAGAESALSNPNGAPMTSAGTSATGRMPFNRRKLRLFDIVTSAESTAAREYLQRELRRSKKRANLRFTRRLRRTQHDESGESMDDLGLETPEDKQLLDGGVGRLEMPFTPAMSAAMLVESLSANPLESLEGMAKCYDGIVAAGVALLDAQTVDPTTPQGADRRSRPTRSEIMAALAPLLITSLQQPSGEVVLMLAKIRRMCGTFRYRRRFVQRIAPCLIRPPRGAMWCLRHQNDMEAILAASELIFDSAFEVFSKGWYDRGQMMLADSKRAETLDSAAQQLRDLSSEPSDTLNLGLHASRRRMTSKMKKKDVLGDPKEPLAEWEVIAVDRQIRVSISNVFSTDWNKVSVHSEVAKPHYRRVATSKRHSALPSNSSTEMSPKSFPSSPRSPARSVFSKSPLSPPHGPVSHSAGTVDNIESTFGSSYSSVQSTVERALSPTPQGSIAAQQRGAKDQDAKSEAPGDSSLTAYSASTPPKSPKSPPKSILDHPHQDHTPTTAMSPKRGTIDPPSQAAQYVQGPAPSSPSASSVGTSGSGELVTYKPVASASVLSSSTSGAPAHYRMLTSTAAERKRTVAACRALRAQIQRFEDAFVQLHGRPPKGTAERAPLATTYAQYREWKRAIRADAASRIQALFRGSSVRWRLLRANDPRITRIVMKRPGRAGYTAADNLINQISIPVEIGQPYQDRSSAASGVMPAANEAMVTAHQHLGPQWASSVVRRRTNSGDRLAGDTFQGPQVGMPYAPVSSSSPAPITQAELSSLSLTELLARKRDLKQQLKQYDMSFARSHGRMPVKAEKEPIRHLYESYNSLKNQISTMEQEGRHPPSPPQALGILPQRTASPPSGSDSGPSGGEDSPGISPLPARSKPKVPKASSPPFVSNTSATPTQDLAALKVEKGHLHQMLRSYEKDFFKEHHRQVSSFADIKPVASQYRRYKEIKKAIASLQSGEK